MILRIQGFLLFLLLPLQILASSTLGFVHYTPAEGLPSSTIYQIYQDRGGYIWLGTEGGLCFFDGYDFKTYTVADGLPGNDVFQIREDTSGTLYMLGLGRISSIKDGVIHTRKDLDFMIGRVFGDLAILGGDTYVLQVNSNSSVFYRLTDEGAESIDAGELTGKHKALRSNFCRTPEGIFVSSGEGLISILPGGELKFFLYPSPDYVGTLKGNYVPGKGILMDTRKGLAYFNKGEFQPVFLGEESGYSQSDFRILYEDSKGNIWIASNQGGLWLATPQSLQSDQPLTGPYLKGETVNKILEDREGNLWVGTMRNGVYFLPMSAQFCRNYSSQNGLGGNAAESIFPLSTGETAVGYDNSGLGYFNLESISNLAMPHYPAYQRVLGINEMEDGRILAACDLGMYIIDRKGKVFRWVGGSMKNIVKDKNGDFWVSSRLGVLNIPKDLEKNPAFRSSVPSSPHFVSAQRTYGLYYDTADEALWMGKLDGLWRKKDGKEEFFGEIHPALSSTIKDIVFWQDRYLLAGSDGYGLIVLDTQSDSLAWEVTEVGKRIVYDLHLDDKGGLWVGCSDGLVYLPDFSPKKESQKAYFLGSRDGLITNEIRDIWQQGDQVWVGTSGGLSIINMELFSSQGSQVPPIYLTKATVGDEFKDLKSNSNLNYTENRIEFSFLALNYGSQSDIEYRYRLIGLEEEWQYSYQRQAKYPSLPPGEYRFEVMARARNGFWPVNTTGISFSISMPFFMTLGFFLLLAFGAVVLIILIFGMRLRSMNKRNQERVAYEEKINGLELKALGSKISPLFIFNSMDAIQRNIVEHREEEAHEYLRKFSFLVRVMTMHARQEKITLAEELRTVQLLLELEQQRLEDSFLWTIRTEPGLDPDSIILPPTIVQPYVEDAIRQGLEPMGEGGLLEIRVLKTPSKLHISVRDNGASDRIANFSSALDSENANTQSQRAGRQNLDSYELLSLEGIQVRVTPQKEGQLVEISVDLEESYKPNMVRE